jgi:hypothetical protein
MRLVLTRTARREQARARSDLDVTLLIWDMHRSVRPEQFPCPALTIP